MNLSVELKAEIVEYVRSRWNAERKGVLLSELGIWLSRKTCRKSRRAGGQPLAQVLTVEFKDVLRLVKHPSQPLQAAVVPVEASLSDDISSHFPTPKGQQDNGPSALRFHRAVWAAFLKALRKGARRFLILRPVIHFVDVSEGESIPIGGIEIERDLFLEGGETCVPRQDQEVEQVILNWAQKHHVDSQQLIAGHGGPTVGDEGTVLHLLLDSIPPAERHRVALPLDLIGILLHRRVGR